MTSADPSMPPPAPVAAQGPTPPSTESGQLGAIAGPPVVFDLKDVKKVTPEEAPVGKPPYVVTAGVSLARLVLGIMISFVLVTVIWIWTSEAAYTDRLEHLMSGTTALTKDLLEPILKERTEFREFWLKIFQMVLLNVLLPVLTALLGYVFSSTREQARNH